MGPEAEEVTIEAYAKDFRAQSMLCQTWTRYLTSSFYDANRETAMQNVFDELACFGE